MKSVSTLLLAVVLFAAGCAPAPEQAPAKPVNAGFLTDYSLLKNPDWENAISQKVYVNPELAASLEKYSGVMVDQPEIFIAVDSPYRGAKPEGLKLIADLIRYLMIGEFIREGYNVVEQPAADVAYVRVALTDMKVEQVKGVTSYIPVEVTIENEAEVARNFMASLEVLDVDVEVEVVDSTDSTVLMAGILTADLDTVNDGNLATWASLGLLLEDIAAGITCIVRTANLPPEGQKAICSAGNTPQ